MSCAGDTCGVGGWGGPKPGDPSNNGTLQAKSSVGGIELVITMPTVNPFAIAYTKLYRSPSNNFLNSVEIATIGGNEYFDRVDSGIEYWYWIRFVSINGTEGDLIGPASATARDSVAQLIEDLTGRIDEGVLSNLLKERIQSIVTLNDDLVREIQDRFGADSALAQAVMELQGNVDGALTVFQQEVVQRTEGDTALVSAMEVMGSKVEDNAAAIISERTARANADSALAQQITTIQASTGDIYSSYINWDFRSAFDGWTLLGIGNAATLNEYFYFNSNAQDYCLISPPINVIGAQHTKVRARIRRVLDTPWEGVLFYRTNNHTYTYDYHKTALNSTKLNEWSIVEWDMSQLTNGGNDWVNSTILQIRLDFGMNAGDAYDVDWISIGSMSPPVSSATLKEESTARIDGDINLASRITTLEARDIDGTVAQAEQRLEAKINTVKGVAESLYTVKLTANGLIGGFGVYNNSSLVEAGFDVDLFWVGRTNGQKRKPFIIDENGVCYINDAKIRQAQVDTLMIGLNQVTIPVGAYTAGNILCPFDTTTEVQTVWINSSGAPIIVTANARVDPSDIYYVWRIYRDGVELAYNVGEFFNGIPLSYSFNSTIIDTPGPGVHKYTITLSVGSRKYPFDPEFPWYGLQVSQRTLTLLEVKR